MITSSHNNQYSYIKRLFTLAIILGTVFIIACTADKKELETKEVELTIVPMENGSTVRNFKTLNLPKGTLIFLDGKPISETEMRELNPELIESDVLLDKETAINTYGNKASNGAYLLHSIQQVSGGGGNENLPSFPGGQKEWTTYLQKNLRYPDEAIDNGTMGMVKVAFTVLADGSLINIKALNDPGDGLAEESVRILKRGPKWVPAKIDGEFVEQRIIQAITYRLE